MGLRVIHEHMVVEPRGTYEVDKGKSLEIEHREQNFGKFCITRGEKNEK